jgi:hypothetical protein
VSAFPGSQDHAERRTAVGELHRAELELRWLMGEEGVAQDLERYVVQLTADDPAALVDPHQSRELVAHREEAVARRGLHLTQ